MSLIRSAGAIRSPCFSGVSRLFSTSSISYKMSTRKRKPQTRNSFERKKTLQVPVRFERERKNSRPQSSPRTNNRRSDESPSPKLGYGRFSGLKEIKTEDTRNAENLVSKIETFDALKLLPEVRAAVLENIRKKTILNSDNYIGPSPNRFEQNFGHVEESLTPNQEEEQLVNIKPTPIQVAAIKVISQYLEKPALSTFAIAAETGSGKTWAYMAPLIDGLKREELDESWARTADKAIIRAVIVVPTHELIDQVYEQTKDALDALNLKCFKWTSATKYEDFVDALKNRIDVLIATPGKLNRIESIRMIKRPQYVFSRTRYMVIDEADTLMDASWIDDTCEAIKRLPSVQNLVFCTATIPKEFNNTMDKLFPTAIKITTPSLHRLPKTIKFSLIDASVQPYQGSKIKALAQALYAIHRDGSEEGYEKRCIVFVNERKDIEKIATSLRETYNHDVTTLTGEDSPEDRQSKVGVFINPPRRLEDIPVETEDDSQNVALPDSNIILKKGTGAKKREGSLKVLVTSDLLARGLNFSAVRNVILYDVPNTSADLLHRAGRTGRMNQAGRVFLIIDRKSEPWVKRLPSIVRAHGLIT